MGKSHWIALVGKHDEARAKSIAKIIGAASRLTPWNSSCLTQAMVARTLLGYYRIPYSLFFGVAQSSEDHLLKAHAWVAVGRVYVTGGNGFDQFTVLSGFSATYLTAQNLLSNP